MFRTIIALGMFIMMGLTACSPFSSTITGSGASKTEQRQVSGYSTIKLSGIGELAIAQTGAEAMSVTADDNVLPLITTEVKDGTLEISLKSDTNVQPKTPIVYAVSVKDLNHVILSGAGNVTIPKFDGSNFTLDLSGAGNATLDHLQVTTLTISLSGTGNVTASGQAQTLAAHCSGVGSYKGQDLASVDAAVTLSGAGSAEVRASSTLDATVSGVGNITYFGNPTVKQHVTGVGSVKKGGD